VRAQEDVEVYPSALAGGSGADYVVEIMQENPYGDAWITGRYTRVANPRTTFSVLEPIRGCGSLATTSDTAVANSCAIGVNAGRAAYYPQLSLCACRADQRPTVGARAHPQASLTRPTSTALATWCRTGEWCRWMLPRSTSTLGCVQLIWRL
jgi:hypothetical protein